MELFLVDPENRIPSTTDIPPQQAHWTRDAVLEALMGDQMKVPLPVELVEMIVDNVDIGMTLEQSKAYREQLMDERAAFVGVVCEEHFLPNLASLQYLISGTNSSLFVHHRVAFRDAWNNHSDYVHQSQGRGQLFQCSWSTNMKNRTARKRKLVALSFSLRNVQGFVCVRMNHV